MSHTRFTRRLKWNHYKGHWRGFDPNKFEQEIGNLAPCEKSFGAIFVDLLPLRCYFFEVAEKRCHNQYVLRVKQIGATPISTSIYLRGDRTLYDLHKAICLAFNRSDDRIYSFYFPKAEIGGYMPGLYPREYTSDVVWAQPDPFSHDKPSNAARTKLDSLHLLVGQTFEYLFDFGESSLHEIKVVTKLIFHSKRNLHAVGEYR